MKFFIAITLLAAAASAFILPADLHLTPTEQAEIEEILAAIHSPSTDPTTAAMLEEMLYQILGIAPVKPPITLPAIIDEFQPPHVGPAIIDFPLPEGAIPVDTVPASPIVPATPAASSPLVQIIVNVNQEGSPVADPVTVDHVPSPVAVVDKPQKPVKPTPVHVVDHFEGEQAVIAQPEPVIIGQLPEAVIVSPIAVAPVVVGPETLN